MTPEYLNECFVWNYTGKLIWKERPVSHFKSDAHCNGFNTRFANKPAGCMSVGGYHQVTLAGRTTGAHRVLYMLYHNTTIPEGLQVDHEDGNRSNNTFKNLRLGTCNQNIFNSGKRKDNTTGYKGVSLYGAKKRFRAHIRGDGKQVHLGTFSTAEEAHEAYQIASVKYAGTFSNFG